MIRDNIAKLLKENSRASIILISTFMLVIAASGVTIGVLLGPSGISNLDHKSQYQQIEDTQAMRVESSHAVVTENETAQYVNVTLTKWDTDVDLSNLTLLWMGPEVDKELSHSSPEKANAASNTDDAGDSFYFTTNPVKDSDSSAPVLNHPSDRIQVAINTTAIRGEPLKGGEEINFRYTTGEGRVIIDTVNIPSTLKNKSTVKI